MTNREIPSIIQGIIPPVNKTNTEEVATIVYNLHAVHGVLHKEIVKSVMCSAAGVLKYPTLVNWKDASRRISIDRNTVIMSPRTTTQVRTGTGPYVSPIHIGIQKIEGMRRSIIPQEFWNTKPLDASININHAKPRDTTQSWIKVIGSKTFTNKSINVYAKGQMDFVGDAVHSDSQKFIDFGLLFVNTTNELRSIFIPTTIFGRPTDDSNGILPGHVISEATVDRVRWTKAKNHYNFKNEFGTRRDKMVDQDFERQNDAMSLPPL